MPVTMIRYQDERGVEQVVTPRALLEEAAQDPFFKWPYPVLKSMLEDEPRPEGISVTQLLVPCLSCEVLKHRIDYTMDLDKSWARWRGTAYHSVLEANTQRGAIAEVRFWAPVPGEPDKEMHGKPDQIIILYTDSAGITHVAITDLKVTKNIPRFGPWANHVEQIQIYGWLMRHATRWDKDLGGFDPHSAVVDKVGLWYVDFDGAKAIEAKRSVDVATKAGAKNATKKVKESWVWSDEETEALVTSRYRALSSAFNRYDEDGSLPPYPAGWNFMTHWAHKWSDVAEVCVKKHLVGV